LGAGAIMKEGINVRGLNTAATLWASATVGSCAGTDMVAQSAALTLFVLDGVKFHADAEEVLAKLPRRGIPMVLRELRDENAKPFAFSTMRKATGEVDYVEALAH
jgi:uncharacterized membrane protein YhiD involved in acid resistance